MTRLNRRHRVPGLPPSKLAILIEEANGICALCKTAVDMAAPKDDPMAPTIDHIVARGLGGSNDWPNLQLAHYRCNNKKSQLESKRAKALRSIRVVPARSVEKIVLSMFQVIRSKPQLRLIHNVRLFEGVIVVPRDRFIVSAAVRLFDQTAADETLPLDPEQRRELRLIAAAVREQAGPF